MRIGSSLIAGLFLAGCSPAMFIGLSTSERKPVALTSAESAIVQAAVRRSLTSPKFAQFDRLAAAQGPDTTKIVCGWVYAPTSISGLVAQPFAGTLSVDRFEVHYIGTDTMQRTLAQTMCGNLGDYGGKT
jgi:hypothetical protein